MKYTLVLLSLNEIDGLKVIWPLIPKKSVDEIFAVDGGSTDGTLEFYKKNNIRVVKQKSKGRGEAFRIGMNAAIGDVVIFFSPDGNEDPKDIAKFRKYFENDKDLDILIASRMMSGAYNEEDTGFFKPRKWVNNAFNFAANILFRRKGDYVTDTINGFRAIKKSSFNKLMPQSMKHTIEYEMTIKAFKHRMKVVEFPTVEGPRIGGYIKAKSLPTGIDFIRLFLLEVWDSVQKSLPRVLLVLILFFSVFTLHQGIYWNIKNNPEIPYSLHVDEVYKISYTLRMDIAKDGMYAPIWLMQKGVGYPSIAKILYDMTDTDIGRGIFEWFYGYDLNSMTGLYLFFRSITAGFSLMLTVGVYKLTRSLHSSNKYAAVLAAFFMATIFGSFFSSIIFKSDIPATLFMVCMLIGLVRFTKNRSRKNLYIAAMFYGFASMTKYSAIAAGLLFPIMMVLHYLQYREIKWRDYLFAGMIAAVAAFVLSPYIFLDLNGFINGLLLQKEYQTTRPLQFEEFGFQPFAILNHILYSAIGPVLLLIFLASLIFILVEIIRNKKFIYIIPTSYFAIYFTLACVTTWIVVRYSVPYFPVIAIFASIFLVSIIEFAKKQIVWKYQLAVGITLVLIVMHFIYFVAFSKMVRHTSSTVQAANWMRENLDETNRLIHVQMLGREPLVVYNYGSVNTLILSGNDINNYIEAYTIIDRIDDIEYILIDERSYSQYLRLDDEKYKLHRDFLKSVMESDKFEIEKKFEIVPEYVGIKFDKGLLPQDLMITSPDILLYKRVQE